jgi:hypothetical protein
MGGAAKLWVPDMAGRNHLTLGTAPTIELGKTGAPQELFTSASSQYLEGVLGGAAALPLMIAGWANDPAGGGVEVIMCVGTNGGNARVQIQTNAARGIVATSANAAGAGATSSVTSTAYTDKVDFHFAGVFTSTASRTAYLDGVAAAADTSVIDPSGTDRVLLGARRNSVGVGAFWSGYVGETGVWGIAPESSIVARLADRGLCFELWYPLRSKRWISIASSGTTITGALGTAVASGLTGTVNANRALAGALGAATASGFTGGVNANRTLAGALGTAVAGGLAGGVNANRTITGALGTATASGFQGTVTNGNSTTIAGALGTAVASGLTGTVNANRTIAGALGTAVASGFQGTVTNDNSTTIAGSLGTAVATGFTGGVTWNRYIAGVLGVATASGFTGGVTNGTGLSHSGVTRLWLIDYYTKAFAKKTVTVEVPGKKRPVLKLRKAAEVDADIPALVARAEKAIAQAVKAQAVKAQADVQAFVERLKVDVAEANEPIIDFAPVLERLTADLDESDDLMLLSMVL